MACYDAGFGGYSPNGSYIRLWVAWSQNANANTSTVEFSLVFNNFNDASYANDNPAWWIQVGGTQIASGVHNFSGSQQVQLGSTSRTYSHDANGNLSLSVSAYFGGAGYGTGLGAATLNAVTVTLPQILRASTIDSASNVTLGGYCNIKWTPKSTTHKYKLKFSLGEWSYTTNYISPNQDTQYTYSSYQIPIGTSNIPAVAAQLPNSKTGTMTAQLTTYTSSNNKIGAASEKTFKVTVPTTGANAVVPTITLPNDSVDISIVSGDSSDIWNRVGIVGKTYYKLKATATGSLGSTIKQFKISGAYSKTIEGASLNHTMDSAIKTYGNSVTFTITAVDSRGATASATTSGVVVHSYSKPLLTVANVSRGSASNTTNCVLYTTYTYSNIGGENTPSCYFQYKVRDTNSWTTYSGGSGSTTLSSNQSYTILSALADNSSYDYRFVLTDSVGERSVISGIISTSAATVDFKAGGTGIALGKMAEYDNLLEVAWKSKFNNDIEAHGDVDVAGELSSPSNNFIYNSQEFNFVPSGYNGNIVFNNRTQGNNGNITGYIFGNGAGGSLGNAIHSGNVSSYASKIDLIWPNASVESPCSGISENKDLSAYSLFFVIFRLLNSDTKYCSFIVPKNVSMKLEHPMISDSAGLSNQIYGRNVYFTNSSVAFSNGWNKPTNGTGDVTANGSVMIPYLVYGVKGVADLR